MSETQQGKNRGCLKAAGIGCLVVSALAVIAIVIGLFAANKLFTKFVQEYTDTKPRELPSVTVSETDAQVAFVKYDGFKTAMKSGVSATPLVLTTRDINTLIQKHPDWKELAGKAFVTIDNSTVKSEVSIPLEGLGEKFKGRYLNGAASFNVAMVGSQLAIHVADIEVKGKRLPENFMEGMRAENMAKEVNKNPDLRPILDRIESISVQTGQITIMPKRK